jgi:hypothetical protein
MSTADRIYKEVRLLPEPISPEVLDFLRYPEHKHGLEAGEAAEDAEVRAWQEEVIARSWSTPEDDVWNDW